MQFCCAWIFSSYITHINTFKIYFLSILISTKMTLLHSTMLRKSNCSWAESHANLVRAVFIFLWEASNSLFPQLCFRTVVLSGTVWWLCGYLITTIEHMRKKNKINKLVTTGILLFWTTSKKQKTNVWGSCRSESSANVLIR